MGSILKKILVTGCNGLVGRAVCNSLVNRPGLLIVGVDIKLPEPVNVFHSDEDFTFYNIDLTDSHAVNTLFEEYKFDSVINCFGIKGSPIRAKERPLDFLTPSIKGNMNIIENCYKHNSFLVFLSSVGVYAPAEVFEEETVWKTLPSENDWFPSWSKRVPELYLEAHKVQYNWENYCILRPANIFGENDNYGEGSTVIASTVKKIYDAKDGDDIIVWGDGKSTRDFVFANDVAEVSIKCSEDERHLVSNIGSGIETSIETVVKTVIEASGKNLNIVYDTTKPNGDRRRKMSTKNQYSLDLYTSTDITHQLKHTYKFYSEEIAKK